LEGEGNRKCPNSLKDVGKARGPCIHSEIGEREKVENYTSWKTDGYPKMPLIVKRKYARKTVRQSPQRVDARTS